MSELDYLDFKDYLPILSIYLIEDLSNIINNYLKIAIISTDDVNKIIDIIKYEIKIRFTEQCDNFEDFQNLINEFSEIYFIYKRGIKHFLLSSNFELKFFGKTKSDNFLYLHFYTNGKYVSKYFNDYKSLFNLMKQSIYNYENRFCIQNMVEKLNKYQYSIYKN